MDLSGANTEAILRFHRFSGATLLDAADTDRVGRICTRLNV
ncbi:hypothetical protein [Novosphingobium sp.]